MMNLPERLVQCDPEHIEAFPDGTMLLEPIMQAVQPEPHPPCK